MSVIAIFCDHNKPLIQTSFSMWWGNLFSFITFTVEPGFSAHGILCIHCAVITEFYELYWASSETRCFNGVKDQYSHGELSQKSVRGVGLSADSLSTLQQGLYGDSSLSEPSICSPQSFLWRTLEDTPFAAAIFVLGYCSYQFKEFYPSFLENPEFRTS